MDSQTITSEQDNILPSKKPDLFKITIVVLGILIVLGLFGNIYLLLKKQTPSVAPVMSTSVPAQVVATPTINLTANWKTFNNGELSFKYPATWTNETNGIRIIGKNPDVALYVATKDSTLMNECMKLDATEKKTGLVIKRFSRATSGEMCAGGDSNLREIWIVPAENNYSPGMSYSYSTKNSPDAENIFNQILSTFKFLPSTTSDQTAKWKIYSFQPIKLTLKVPPELTVHAEEPNPGNDFTAYIQNYPFNSPVPKENAYQLYLVWQKTPSVTQSEFQQLKDELDVNSVKNTLIAGFPAIKGQIKGERNRYVTYILKDNTKISLFTSEVTQTNKELTDQILSTFRFD